MLFFVFLISGSIGESVQKAVIIEYEKIPHFPRSTVDGHRGRLIFGRISGLPVVCMQGRFHFYEGYPLSTCVMPVRLMKLLGITHLIASNAAGGVNSAFQVGDIMLIKDHLNFMGMAGIGPLTSAYDPRWGPRFFSTADAYDAGLLEATKTICKSIGLDKIIREGVYTCMGGPNYETIADNRALKLLGVDAIGMSTIHEVVTARQCGIHCLAFSLITNLSPTSYGTELETSNEDVLAVGRDRESDLRILVENIVGIIGKNV